MPQPSYFYIMKDIEIAYSVGNEIRQLTIKFTSNGIGQIIIEKTEKATTHDYTIGYIFCPDASHYCFMDKNTQISFYQADTISMKPMKCAE